MSCFANLPASSLKGFPYSAKTYNGRHFIVIVAQSLITWDAAGLLIVIPIAGFSAALEAAV